MFSNGPFSIENNASFLLQNIEILIDNNILLNTIFLLKNHFLFEIKVN